MIKILERRSDEKITKEVSWVPKQVHKEILEFLCEDELVLGDNLEGRIHNYPKRGGIVTVEYAYNGWEFHWKDKELVKINELLLRASTINEIPYLDVFGTVWEKGDPKRIHSECKLGDFL